MGGLIMGYLKYKGYTGSVEYSEDDKCLFGKVQGMSKDSITYEGSTVEELTADSKEQLMTIWLYVKRKALSQESHILVFLMFV